MVTDASSYRCIWYAVMPSVSSRGFVDATAYPYVKENCCYEETLEEEIPPRVNDDIFLWGFGESGNYTLIIQIYEFKYAGK